MKRTFTPQEAEELISAHEAIKNDISFITKRPSNLEIEIKSKAFNLSSDGKFSQQMIDELARYGTVDINPDIKLLYQLLSQYIDSQKLVDDTTQWNDTIKQNEKDLSDLRRSSGNLKWFFSSGKQQQKAANAYNRLSQLLENGYADSIKFFRKKCDDLLNIPTDEAVDRFADSQAQYRTTLYNISSSLIYPNILCEDLKKICQKAEDQYAAITKASLAVNEMKSNVQKAADKMAAMDVVKILKDIPIEEINRDRHNFKIKILRDSGYSSIADLFNTTEYQLSTIKGISENAASEIKDCVDEIAKNAAGTIRLRLNADERTPAAGELLRAVYQCRINRDADKKLSSLKNEYENETSRHIANIETIGNSINWLFLEESVKQSKRESYSYIKQTGLREIPALTQRINLSYDELWEDFKENSVQYYNILEEIVPERLGHDDDTKYLLPAELVREIQEEDFFPNGLKCELRNYQLWGVKYALHQEKVLLGDEMGLGKTIQAIATMVSLRNTGATHFMVVCPASVLSNWIREITAKSKLRVIKVHGADRRSSCDEWLKKGGVAVTTYETTRVLAFEHDFKFSMLVVDEAHYLKNPQARRTIDVKEICSHAERILLMTGTALENKVDEMISLIRILNKPVADKAKGVSFMSSAPEFRKIVSPVYYRRKREDVLTELPELIETKEWCTMGAEEENYYESVVLSRNYMESRRVSWNISDMNKSSKATRLIELVDEAKSDGRKIIVFSFFLDTIRKVTKILEGRCTEPINGSVTPQKRQEIIDEFDSAPSGTVLPAQIQSGGTGLNIQTASVIIFCEPQLKPSIENQAISRAYRMGQTRNVLVFRLLCENTVDERILEMLAEKQAIFDAFADKSDAAKESIELDNATMKTIITAEIERINKKRLVS